MVAPKVEDMVKTGCIYKAIYSVLWTQDEICAPPCYVTIVGEGPPANHFDKPLSSLSLYTGTQCSGHEPADKDCCLTDNMVFNTSGNCAEDNSCKESGTGSGQW